MKLFDFDVTEAARAYRQQGWVHIPSGITPEFHEYARRFVGAVLEAGPDRVGNNRANKDQFRFEFADAPEMQEEVLPLMCQLAGLDPEGVVLSERHVNAYRADADPDPIPHKDRNASQLSVGVAVDVSPGSHLLLWPDADRSPNPYDSSARLYEALPPQRRPEEVLARAMPVVIHDRPGDIVVFAGSTTWHCRRAAAGTTNLFIKLNDFSYDPLGEDARHDGVPSGKLPTLVAG